MFEAKLRELLTNERYRDAANCFAKKYARFSPSQPAAKAVQCIEDVLGYRKPLTPDPPIRLPAALASAA